MGLNKKQWGRGGRETYTKHLPCSSVDNFGLAAQINQTSTVLFFVLVISIRVCDNRSSFSTFSKTFTEVHFVVKPTLRSNKSSKLTSFLRYHRRL